jgi:hypothetical protein
VVSPSQSSPLAYQELDIAPTRFPHCTQRVARYMAHSFVGSQHRNRKFVPKLNLHC